MGLCRAYVCKDNSDVTIVKELLPKNPWISRTAHLDHGDSVSTDGGIDLLVNSTKTLRTAVVPESGRHKAQNCTTKDFTQATIVVPFSNVKNLRDPAQQLPSPKTLRHELSNSTDS